MILPTAWRYSAGVTRLRQVSEPMASQISHRYAQARIAAKTSKTHSSSPPTVPAAPRWLRSVRDFARKEWPLRGSTTSRSAIADRRHPSGGYPSLAAPFGPSWGRGACDGHRLDPPAVFMLAAAPGVGTL